jgi:hypothetical protein
MIRRAASTDVGQLARTATRAFVDDPVMRWLFPDDADYQGTNPLLVQFMARRWQATESLWCTDDGVAMAGWVPPGRPDVSHIERPAVGVSIGSPQSAPHSARTLRTNRTGI